VALKVHQRACDRLACAVGAMVNTLSPDRIILGGGVMMAGQVIIDAVTEYTPKYCWPTIWERCEIVAAQLGISDGRARDLAVDAYRQLAAAGLPRVTFHSLRHAAASYLLAAGVPMRVVQEVLGHSQLSTTADIYSHVLPELQADAAARMGTLLDAIGATPS
jgi:predicted NBD/HSP70 family sugar kinase